MLLTLKFWLQDLLDRLEEHFPPNRVVVLLTPLLFAPAAGAICAWVAQHFPGLPSLDPVEVTAIFIAGGTFAVIKAYKWLDGWIKLEVENPPPPPIV